MADYISRETALELIDNAPIIAGNENETLISAPKLSDEVYCIPAADVRPVVRAHWIYHEDDFGDYYECSHCHDEYVVYEDDMCWKHCPTCGAEMEPDEDGQRGEKNSG